MTGLYGNMSVGYRATKNNTTNYIITAGHAFLAKGTSIKAYINKVDVGYCADYIMSHSDAAIVAITNFNYTATNILNESPAYSLSTLVTAATSGATIIKEGIATHYTAGVCQSSGTGQSISDSNGNTWYISDLFTVDGTSSNPMADKGDSGGIAYSIVRTTVGIATAASISIGWAWFSKASNINSAFSVSRY